MRARRIMVSALLLGLAGLAGPVAAQRAQAGVFDQAYRRNPFNLLLTGRGGVATYVSGDVANNSYTVTDLWAVGQLREDFRISDVFLIGGLVPSGEGMRMTGRGDGAVAVAVPMGRLSLGLQAGGRVLGEGSVPDNIAALAREGSTSEVLQVDLTELNATVVAFSDVGLTGLFDVARLAGGKLQAGVGVHYLYGIHHSEFGFTGPEGTDQSVLRMSSAGVDADIAFVRPAGLTQRSSGTGLAADAFVAVTSGKLFLSVLASDIGSLTLTTGEREVTRLRVRKATMGEFLDTLSAFAPDTVAGVTRTVSLPTRLRLEASYQLMPRVGVGVAVQHYLGEEFSANPQLATGLLEIRPLRWLPIRLGASVGGEFGGTGAEAGLGLEFSHLRLNVGLSSTGSMSPSDLQGGALHSGLTLVF